MSVMKRIGTQSTSIPGSDISLYLRKKNNIRLLVPQVRSIGPPCPWCPALTAAHCHTFLSAFPGALFVVAFLPQANQLF